ncbi:MAG: aminopeptidase P family protein [Clostridiales bacterium]|jgi:Xaa-Pro aminopeptidase|nr:aminopeptidase P family protein [Clostridiales bacterium]
MNPVEKLRKLMEREKIDALLITKFDPHQSEDAADYWNSVQFVSGFTGSSGAVAITKGHAGLWTDGRYYIQAQREISGCGLELHKASEPGEKSYLEFAKDSAPPGGVIGFDGRTVSAEEAAKLQRLAKGKKITLKSDVDLVGEIWADRPEDAKYPILDHPVAFSGMPREEKLKIIYQKMAQMDADAYVISSLDDIAWLLNLRGGDLQRSTLFKAFLVLESEKASLFADLDEIAGVKEILERAGVRVFSYDELWKCVSSLDSRFSVMYAPAKTCWSIVESIKGDKIDIDVDETEILKSVKNKAELECLERINVRDGAAMVRFLKWIKENAGREHITEYDIDAKLREFREMGENYICPSFTAIAGYMANAAMMHYSAEKGSAASILAEGFLLVDSGGHYWDGTTDITRTIALGTLSPDMKRDFTLVLKGHIALAKTVFLYGATGSNLDIAARLPLWERGIDYKSGTGHGIGFCLCVHEGPARISMKPNRFFLEPGHILTNEPGIYREGLYGIRTENTLVVEEHVETEFGRFLKFRTISLCPIDSAAIDFEILTEDERQWLNSYHRMVFEKLSPVLSEDEKAWLEVAVAEV